MLCLAGKQTSLANTPHLSQHHHLPHQGQAGQPQQQQQQQQSIQHTEPARPSSSSSGSAQSSQRVAAARPASSNSTLVAVKQDPEELGELGSSTVTGYVDSTTYPSPAPDCSPMREAEVAPSHPSKSQICLFHSMSSAFLCYCCLFLPLMYVLKDHQEVSETLSQIFQTISKHLYKVPSSF